MSKRDAWEDFILDDSFVAGAAHREASAAEREALARTARKNLRKTERQSARQRRRQNRRARLSRYKTVLAVAGLLVAALAWSRFVRTDETAAQAAARTPSKARVVYALPSDTTLDDTVIPAVRHELGIVQAWFESQTGGRHIRLVADGDEISVETRHLSVTAAELRDRSDAASIVDDELRPKQAGSAAGSDEILVSFIPVTFPEQVRCGEGSQAGFAIIWMGSCDTQPSLNSTTFGQGATRTIAHELVHALGAVEPCAPHYGRNGHVIDDARDILYDGPTGRPAGTTLLLDPGHDAYYRTGNSKCTDIATHRAWTK